jgi:hypothetical protein
MRLVASLSWVFIACIALFSAMLFVTHLGLEYNHAHDKHLEEQRKWKLFHKINCLDSTDLLTVASELSRKEDRTICDTALSNSKMSPHDKALEHLITHFLKHDVFDPLAALYERFKIACWIALACCFAFGLYLLKLSVSNGPVALFYYAMQQAQGHHMTGTLPNKQL